MMYHNTLYRHVLKSLFSDILSRFTFLFFSSGCVCVCGGGGGRGGGDGARQGFFLTSKKTLFMYHKEKGKKKTEKFLVQNFHFI